VLNLVFSFVHWKMRRNKLSRISTNFTKDRKKKWKYNSFSISRYTPLCTFSFIQIFFNDSNW